MGRLTEQDEQGNWCVKGLPWKDTYVGQVITENTSEKTYIALCKLKEYEESGLDPEEVYGLKERDTAKKPDYEGDEYDNEGNIIYDTWICPNCEEHYEVDYDNYDFCPECGQKLDWRERYARNTF